MHVFNRALSACLILTAVLVSHFAAFAQDTDPFALLFGHEEERLDASETSAAGFDDLNIVTLRLRDLTLDEAFVAFDTEDGVCLPFEPLVQAMEFPIETAGDDRAKGWFVETGQTIEIDFAMEEAQVSGRSVDLPGVPFLNTSEGWCVTLDALSVLFDMKFEHDARNLRVSVIPERILPIEARLERKAFRDDVLGSAPEAPKDYKRAENPHRWLSWPVADVGVDVSANSGGKIQARFDIEAAGDILNTSGRIRTVGGSKGGVLDNLRVTLTRDLWENRPGKPTTRHRINAGDVSTPSLPLVSRSLNGAGIVITNKSALQATLFDTTEIRGPLPVGWEAELYQGEELIDFVVEPDSNGDYLFQSVPLRSGYNRFTVKLYGPYGETEEREFKQFVGAELEPENETSYFFGVVDSRTPLVEAFSLSKGVTEGSEKTEEPTFDELQDQHDEALEALFDEALSSEEDTQQQDRNRRQGFKFLSSASYGVNSRMTVRLDASINLEEDGQSDSVASASVAASLAGGYAVARVISDGSGTPAVEAAFQRRVFERSNLSLRAISYGDLETELTGKGLSRKSHLAQIRGNSYLPIGGQGIPIQSELNLARSYDGNVVLDGATRLSSTVAGVRMTKSFNYFHTQGQTETASAIGGNLLFSKRQGELRLLGNVGYSLGENGGLSSLGVSAQRPFAGGSFGTLSVNRDMVQKRSTVSMGWSKRFKRFSLSTNARLSDDKSWSLGARLGFSLSRKKDRLLPDMTAGGNLSRRAAVQAHSFIDDNLNGRFDIGETEVEGIRLNINGTAGEPESGPDGRVTVNNVPTDSVQNVSVHLASIDDPFLVPAEKGRSYVLRPGQIVTLPIALQPTGDLEGVVNVIKGEHTLVAGGIPVEVLDRDGTVVAKTETDFDGYFYLDKLPLRELIVRVSDAAMEGTDIVSEDLNIRLTADEPSALDANITVFVN